MAKNMKEPLSVKRVLLSIVDIADTTDAQFTGNPFINFFNVYYSGGTLSYDDLGFIEGALTASDSPFTVTDYTFRLDHVASDFTLTFPSISTEKKSYLGSKDSVGTPNSYLDEQEPDKSSISVTVSGKPSDLDKLIAQDSGISVTDYTRYNFGSRPSKRFGFVVGVIDNPALPEDADNITQIYFLNNCVITEGGDIKATGNGNYERTLSIECDATDLWNDIADGQNEPAVINNSL